MTSLAERDQILAVSSLTAGLAAEGITGMVCVCTYVHNSTAMTEGLPSFFSLLEKAS